MRQVAVGKTSQDLIAKIHNNECTMLVGDALTSLKKFPHCVFKCCITSPPYWGLRDYGIQNQLGAETCLNEYIEKLVNIFGEVKRVLTDDGTLWLNLGDSYTSGNRTWRDRDSKNPARAMVYRPPTPPGLKPKDLVGVPWRVAFELQKSGWYLRSDVVWHKPNCQPESVRDRPTRSHEYLFLLTKSERYYYNQESIKEKATSNGHKRNRRSVWSINTEAFPGAHFATFPTKLVEPCVLASSQQHDFVLDPFMGSGTVAEVCYKLNRKFVGIDVNEEYVGLAVKRVAAGNKGHAWKEA